MAGWDIHTHLIPPTVLAAAHRGEFGRMTALRGTDIVMVPLAEAVETLKTVPQERYEEAECVL